MRLLNVHTLELESFPRLKPPYAIASHRWSEGGESSFQDVQAKVNLHLPGYQKIQQFAAFVRSSVRNVDYLWIDTCCIDKTSSQELQEAITAMYRWYEDAAICLAYLNDVQTGQGIHLLRQSVWFTRGWTLQELLAPKLVIFLSTSWDLIGHKAQNTKSIKHGLSFDQLGPSLNSIIARFTGIPEAVITRPEHRRTLSVDDRLGWMRRRTTTRPEDMAYCLLGLFEVSMPLIYEEGQRAAERRLRRAIADANEDMANHSTAEYLPNPDSRRIMRVGPGEHSTQNVLSERIHHPQDITTSPDLELLEFLRKLYERTYPYQDRKNRNNKPIRGTCKWFVDQENFRVWNSPPISDHGSSPILYVTADPGCGKSVLSRHLIDTVLPREDRTVCYAFFKDDFEDQRTSMSAICALLHQLLYLRPYLSQTNKVLRAFRAQGDKFFESSAAIWDTFAAAAAAAASEQEIICVIDALDECRDTDRSQFLSMISTTSTRTLRFLVTSRPYEYVTRGVRLETSHGMSLIHIAGDHEATTDALVREIQLVVEHRIDDIAEFWRLSDAEQQLLRRNVLNVSNRSYLWVKLVFDRLMNRKKGITKKDILDITTNLPQGIHDAYEKLLARCQDRSETTKLLSLILAAKRPLLVEEVAIALAYDESQGFWSGLVSSIVHKDRIREHVRDISGLFISIIDDKIYLLHQTAREFLLRAQRSDEDIMCGRSFIEGPDPLWQHSIRLTDAHAVAAGLCMHILALYLDDGSSLSSSSTHKYTSGPTADFLVYCSQFWPTHYRQSSNRFRTANTQVAKKLCSPGVGRARWLQHNNEVLLPTKWYHDKMRVSTLHLTSALGLDEAVDQLLSTCSIDDDHSKIIDLGDSVTPTPLFLAAESGHAQVVRLLLETGKVDINFTYRYGQTSLMRAAEGGHAEVVKLLLKSSMINVNCQSSDGATALYCAAASGNPEVVKLLLAGGKADVSLGDENGSTPLHMAVWNGKREIAELLLTAGKADVNQANYGGRTSLHGAAIYGYREITEMLLKTYEADASLTDDEELTALAAAQERWFDEGTMNDKEHTAIAELLTEYFSERDQHR